LNILFILLLLIKHQKRISCSDVYKWTRKADLTEKHPIHLKANSDRQMKEFIFLGLFQGYIGYIQRGQKKADKLPTGCFKSKIIIQNKGGVDHRLNRSSHSRRNDAWI